MAILETALRTEFFSVSQLSSQEGTLKRSRIPAHFDENGGIVDVECLFKKTGEDNDTHDVDDMK